jgi:hypothetical protein
MEHEALGSSCFKEGPKLEYITGLMENYGWENQKF